MNPRNTKYHLLNTQLAYLNEGQLLSYLSKTEKTNGWGTTQIISLEDQDVFVKRIPLPEKQQDIYSSQNHYDLPTYYNYGVGSAGIGPARELF